MKDASQHSLLASYSFFFSNIDLNEKESVFFSIIGDNLNLIGTPEEL